MGEGQKRIITSLMARHPGLTRGLVHGGFNLCARLAGIRRCAPGDGQYRPAPLRPREMAEFSPSDVMGLPFDNPLGVAAGFDRHGRIGRRIGNLGFGHIEIGTLTPRPEPGHNRGLVVLESIPAERQSPAAAILGISIGQNRATPPQRSLDDYLAGLRAAWPLADYIAVNLSGAASAALLAEGQPLLYRLLRGIKNQQASLQNATGRYVPIAAKIRLDLSSRRLPVAVEMLKQLRFDGLIAAMELVKPGDLSGPERWRNPQNQNRAADQLSRLNRRLEGQLPIISVGGVVSQEDIRQRLAAGAALVQIHNGLIYQGAEIVRWLNRPTPAC